MILHLKSGIYLVYHFINTLKFEFYRTLQLKIVVAVFN